MFDSTLHSLIGFVSDHAAWAYRAAFLAALLEAIPVIGSFVPGTTAIVAISALIPTGELSLVIVLAAASFGGILGDGAAFWAGHRLKRHTLEIWPLSNYPKVLAQAQEFFRRRGTFAVFFARFVAPVRAFVPIVAGALGMSPRRFFAVNIPAVLAWAAAHVMASAFAGNLLVQLPLGRWLIALKAYAIPAVAVVTLTAFAIWAARHWQLCAAHLHAKHGAPAADK